MKLFSSKKAQGDIESYFVAIKLILAMSAIIAMSAYVYSIATDTYFEKTYLSRDLAFTANTIYFAPGSIYNIYDREKLSKFGVTFSNPKASLLEYDEKTKGLPFIYYYASDLNYKFQNEEVRQLPKVYFQKSSGTVEIKPYLQDKTKLIDCPNIDTIDPLWNQNLFLMDPGHGDGTGLINGDKKEGLIAGSIGFSLSTCLNNKKTTRDNIGSQIQDQTRKSKPEVSKLIKESDIIISIHIGSYSESANNLKAYVSSAGNEELAKKRKKLGCCMINELLSYPEISSLFDGGNVIAVNPEYLQDDYKTILNNEKTAVVIELGNIQSPRTDKLQDQEVILRVSSSIYDSLKKYYEKDE
ncbi:MAG: N-acetylmuramoyl-L-alanine amidase [Nanoarchaeota archaeon]|nr:N-acetylmuramoyl-L-alanine amidase [Nanoarchaeota archaeon]MBU1004281.1 N-acetylmuramoyl-L-alanine amidase [Nanoarchaeota archaeon]MBU1946460.1 N-acetylmuramoyl-L-alanine amidase [Nanoarchaeota archaeon]